MIEKEEHLGLYEVLGALLEDPSRFLPQITLLEKLVTTPIALSPSLFGALSSLETLALVSNPALAREIPPNFLSQNNLQGKIPREIGGLVRHEQLDLSYNNPSGDIPQEIGGLGKSQVPSSVGQLQLLQKIDLSSNRLRGIILRDVGQLQWLVLFDLSQNLINGSIPDSLSGLEILECWVVEKNPINSEIPYKFGTLPSLDRPNLSNNQLSGALSLPEDFIERLGKRLDVRGNNGLCAINPLYKKKGTSANLISTPLCLKASGATNDTALAGEEEEPNVSERMKPFGQYPVENNSYGFLCVSNEKMKFLVLLYFSCASFCNEHLFFS
ncbi:LRR receptor-like serine/threonine-protein kinase RCH1 [Pyrus ussuriensis x Pyrus communis]|uniref:LRR receptor-like serine/threonine-protein kinase RCH1 n=1 Tax=Pyrus ussuriensis x Pyrus communis TaxID=2448454 RepID=A0A5N5FEU2_9ROSA|nr:LRR receptor-like serine/threonine-protein kinase RCH1 [Pyrus ussuriensis x Pyrus communis]